MYLSECLFTFQPMIIHDPPIQMEKILELHNLAKESAAKFDKKRFIYEI